MAEKQDRVKLGRPVAADVHVLTVGQRRFIDVGDLLGARYKWLAGLDPDSPERRVLEQVIASLEDLGSGAE